LPVVFLTVDAEGKEILIPTLSHGNAQWTGSFLSPGKYEISLKWTGGDWVAVGTYDLPEDPLRLATEEDAAKYAEENGGYCVYFDSIEGGVRINYKGVLDKNHLIEMYDKYKPKQVLVNGQVWERPSGIGFH
jgi:hypothetical protein